MEGSGKFKLQKGTFMDMISMLAVVIAGKATCVLFVNSRQRPSEYLSLTLI